MQPYQQISGIRLTGEDDLNLIFTLQLGQHRRRTINSNLISQYPGLEIHQQSHSFVPSHQLCRLLLSEMTLSKVQQVQALSKVTDVLSHDLNTLINVANFKKGSFKAHIHRKTDPETSLDFLYRSGLLNEAERTITKSIRGVFHHLKHGTNVPDDIVINILKMECQMIDLF
jgi:hypothetical protein